MIDSKRTFVFSGAFRQLRCVFCFPTIKISQIASFVVTRVTIMTHSAAKIRGNSTTESTFKDGSIPSMKTTTIDTQHGSTSGTQSSVSSPFWCPVCSCSSRRRWWRWYCSCSCRCYWCDRCGRCGWCGRFSFFVGPTHMVTTVHSTTTICTRKEIKSVKSKLERFIVKFTSGGGNSFVFVETFHFHMTKGQILDSFFQIFKIFETVQNRRSRVFEPLETNGALNCRK
mmetsp:Transcript_38950/g.61679  ORF Transcript_38950/g.61679 Transcript_38950/m.61679 type:complete len:227 (+) Transcript_38950:1456-2136(+)